MNEIHEQFELLRSKLPNSDKWTAGDYGNYFAMFCHGWYGRMGEATYQKGESDAGLQQSHINSIGQITEIMEPISQSDLG